MTFDPFAATIDDARAEAARRLERRKRGLPVSEPSRAPIGPQAGDTGQERAPRHGGRIVEDGERGQLEKELQHQGDKLTLAIGGRVVRFSQPRRTGQTRGIADSLYCFPRLGLAVWWEWKAPDGRQRPDQRDFEELVSACGHLYRTGGLGDYKAWLAERGVCAFDAEGRPILNP